LAPGESTVVELIFKTKNYRTKVSKYATIYSNDPDQPTVKIHLSSNVYPQPDTTLPYRLSQDTVAFSQKDKKCEIELVNVGNSDLIIEPVGYPLEGLKVNIKNDDPKPGQKSELKLEWAKDFEKENLERSITFQVRGSELGIYKFSLPIVIQGTDPTPPKVSTKARTKNRSAATTKRPTPKSAVSPVRTKDKSAIAKPSKVQATETVKPVDTKISTEENKKKEPPVLEKTTTEEKDIKSPEQSSEENQ